MPLLKFGVLAIGVAASASAVRTRCLTASLGPLGPLTIGPLACLCRTRRAQLPNTCPRTGLRPVAAARIYIAEESRFRLRSRLLPSYRPRRRGGPQLAPPPHGSAAKQGVECAPCIAETCRCSIYKPDHLLIFISKLSASSPSVAPSWRARQREAASVASCRVADSGHLDTHIGDPIRDRKSTRLNSSH